MAHLKRLLYVFIPVFAILLMSHNTFALTATVTGTSGVSATVNGRTYSGSTNNNSASLFKSWDSQTAYIYNGDLTALCFDTYNPIPAGSYFSVSVRLGQYSGSSSSNSNAIGLHNTFAGFSSGANWALISQNVESLDNTYIVVNVTGLVGDTASTGFCFSPANGSYIASNDTNFSNFSIVVSPVSFWLNEGNGDVVNGLNEIEDAINEQNDKEQQATDNISDQSADDMENTENQQTTNIIGVISSFFSSISSFSGSSCDVNLDFPTYAGGRMSVNVCQNRDKAGNLIAVFTSLTLVLFYLPLAFKLLSMIYNEIRSFTNG